MAAKQSKPVLTSLLELAHSISDWGSELYTLKRMTLTASLTAIIVIVSFLNMYFGLAVAWVVFIVGVVLLVILGLAELVTRFEKDK